MRKILQAVAERIITIDQAEWLLSDVKGIDVPTMDNDRLNRLNTMMRECYGYLLSRSTGTSSLYVLHNGSSVIDQIGIYHDDLSVNIANEEWVKGYKENLKKYGLS